MLQLRKGRYLVRTATSAEDLARAYALRRLCFGTTSNLTNDDPFDAVCTQALIEDMETGTLVCCFRIFPVKTRGDLSNSYSAQFYNLDALEGFPRPMAEIGRFCIHPTLHDPDILRIAWGALAQWVDREGVRMLFGCASFAGDEATLHLDAFSLLHRKHSAPAHWLPGAKAGEVFGFAEGLRDHTLDLKRAQTGIPPLLRTYLLMGGWTSDHAVFDRALRTMHVFTAVEIDAIPPARARLLRAVAP